MSVNENTSDLQRLLHPSDEDVMHFLEENGIIDVGDVRNQIAEMNLENYIAENHPHKIWQGSNGRWYTYVDDESAPKKRRLVAKSDKHKLLDLLCETSDPEIEYPKVDENATIRDLYPLWLEHKSLMSEDTYITRIKVDWKRYYENDTIVDIPIRQLNKILLESWVLHLIRDNAMTKTKYYNASLIMRQIFQYAIEIDLLVDNPFSRVRKNLGKFFKRKRKPADETQVYSNREIQSLEKLIWEDFAQQDRKVYKLAPLAILFQLYTGLRISEICAVKYSDIQPNGKLRIQRMLVNDTREVRDRTKTYAGEREIYLPVKARAIIEKTKDFRRENGITCEEFIFSLDDRPIPERPVNEYLRRYCKRLDIPYRSSHKLRKTAVSSMVNAGISLNAVKEFAGHVDEKTTLAYYTFDREEDEKRNEQFEKALSYVTTT